MSGDYTSIGTGIIVFFFLMAILSVPLAATTISYCIRGMVLTDDSRKSIYRTLFIITVTINAIFLPAVITYQWLNADSGYQQLYHFVGYFGNITLAIIASSLVSKDKIGSIKIFFISVGVSIAYLIFVAIVSRIFLVTSGYSYETRTASAFSMFLGVGYASIQIIIPIINWAIVSNNREKLVQTVALKKGLLDIAPSNQPLVPTIAPTGGIVVPPVYSYAPVRPSASAETQIQPAMPTSASFAEQTTPSSSSTMVEHMVISPLRSEPIAVEPPLVAEQAQFENEQTSAVAPLASPLDKPVVADAFTQVSTLGTNENTADRV